MITYIVEREIEGIGLSGEPGLRLARARSHEAMARLGPRIRWCHSWIGADRLLCLYRSEDVAAIHEHARLTDFPVGNVLRVLSELSADRGQGHEPSHLRAMRMRGA